MIDDFFISLNRKLKITKNNSVLKIIYDLIVTQKKVFSKAFDMIKKIQLYKKSTQFFDISYNILLLEKESNPF